MAGKKLPVDLGGILRAAIGMVNAARRLLSAIDGSPQGGDRQARIDRPADGVADDQARPGIEDDGDVDEAGWQRDIGDIADPELAGTARANSFARFGKIGPSWSLSVVATNRLLALGCRPCSRIRRRIFL
jgi:hypothetical protein